MVLDGWNGVAALTIVEQVAAHHDFDPFMMCRIEDGEQRAYRGVTIVADRYVESTFPELAKTVGFAMIHWNTDKGDDWYLAQRGAARSYEQHQEDGQTMEAGSHIVMRK